MQVATYIQSHLLRGPGRASSIAGRGMHNQQIERLWVNVFFGCTLLYYQVFYSMEQARILNIDNLLHMFFLHYVFLPKINHALTVLEDAWIYHPLSTEGNLSPLQLWMSGLAEQQPDLDAQVCILYCLLFVTTPIALVSTFCVCSPWQRFVDEPLLLQWLCCPLSFVGSQKVYL